MRDNGRLNKWTRPLALHCCSCKHIKPLGDFRLHKGGRVVFGYQDKCIECRLLGDNNKSRLTMTIEATLHTCGCNLDMVRSGEAGKMPRRLLAFLLGNNCAMPPVEIACLLLCKTGTVERDIEYVGKAVIDPDFDKELLNRLRAILNILNNKKTDGNG